MSNSDPDPQTSAPFDPTQPSVPISYPIKTLNELESRSYFESFHYPFNKASVSIQSGPAISSSSLPNRRRLLVCHDMDGGYGDDKWVQGGTNPDAYAIWHWHLIDIFVYFSHSLVTLPPPCWTNTAHKHGVRVLGTFITEWNEGRLISNTLLKTKESAHMFAERLVELAVALGFDGWLLNMEVKLDVEQIPNLKEFINHLSTKMHSSLPGSLVIWYDSVTIDGELLWQDQLNDKNKPFFDICDGIFVNYTWKEDYPRVSAFVAGDRKYDVYMGIDVFGRNTYGGGLWNANVALDVLRNVDVSAAIFAPGWVYQTKQPPDFQAAQNRWWSLVEKSWGLLRNYPKMLPFYTNFDQGRGYHFSVDGVQVASAPWCNISCQGFQPFLDFVEGPSVDSIEVFVNSKEASYSGGGNITFRGSLEDTTYFRTRLFRGEVILGELPILFIYSVKSEGNSCLGLALELCSTKNERKSILIAPGGAHHLHGKFTEVIEPHEFEQNNSAPGWVINKSAIIMNGYSLTEIQALCYRSNLDDRVSVSANNYFSVLGHLIIKTADHNPDFPHSNSWLVGNEDIKWTFDPKGSKSLSIKITWRMKDGRRSMFPNCHIYVEKLSEQAVNDLGGRTMTVKPVQEFLGTAKINCFYVSSLHVPTETSTLKFIIQVCGNDGTNQKLDDSPYLLLKVDED